MKSTTFLFSAVLCIACTAAFDPSKVTWHVVWVGGQSNSVGTNSQSSGYPTWPTTDLIQMFCWKGQRGCATGSFAPAQVPIYGESNVGFSQTYANLLLQTLPPNHGVILVNTGVGGTGFHAREWNAPNGPLLVQSVNAIKALFAALPKNLTGTYTFHSMLWHQGEQDAGDNGDNFHADYCTYLGTDLSALIDFVRVNFPGASNSTPFIDGGMLPYWVDKVQGTQGVMTAIYAINTSRVCSATADSKVFPDFLPGGIPNGDPNYRSGVSNDVIHFTATQAFFLGFQYWEAYGRATALTSVVPSPQTQGCPGLVIQANVSSCS